MSRKIADLLIKFSGDTYEFSRTTDKLKKDLNNISKSCVDFGKSMSMYITAPLAGLAAVSMKNAAGQEQADAKLLKALKGRVDVQQHLIVQAGELQSKSTLEDDAIIQQQAFLATLGLTEAQIKKCTIAAMETSYALEDQGVTFEMAAKSIAGMYSGATGRIGMMIPELKDLTAEELKAGEGVDLLLSKYQGTAEYMAGQGLNPLIQLKNILGDLSEDFGKVMLPLVQSMSVYLKEFLGVIQSLTPETKKWIVVASGLAAAIGPVTTAFGKIIGIIPALKSLFLALVSPTGLVTAAVLGLAAAIGYLAYRKQAFENEMIGNKVEYYASKDYTLEDLKKIRAQKLQDNTSANADFQYAKTELNPLTTTSSLSGYVSNFIERKETKETARVKVDISYIDIQALDEVIRRKEEEERLMKDTQSITNAIIDKQEDVLDLFKSHNSELTVGVGLLGEMGQRLGELQKLRDASNSTSEIAYYNSQIDKLQRDIDRLRERRNESIVGPVTDPLNRSSLMNPGPIALSYDSSALSGTRLGLGWDGSAEGMARWREGLRQEAEKTQSFIAEMGSAIQAGLVNIVTSFAEGLGNMFSGEGIESLGDGIIKSVGNLLKTLGVMLITFGTTMQGFQAALASIWKNPVLAITLGIAMIAVGTAMASSISKRAEQGVALAEGGLAFGPTMALVGDNRGAGSDPEVIAPLSKLRQYGLGGGSVLQITGGEFIVRGSDLVLSLNRENARMERING